MHCTIYVNISSSSFQTKTFLTHHSIEDFEIRIGSHESEGLIANRPNALTESAQCTLVVVVTGIE